MTGSDGWAELAPARRVVYERFAATGAPPSPIEAARELGAEVGDVLSAWRQLHDRHQLVLGLGWDAIRMAHPFSAAPMGFVVRASDDRLWWGGCAWDSFGIVAALGEDLEVETRCPNCHRLLEMSVGPHRPPDFGVIRIPAPARQWWSDVVATCAQIRLFCDGEHAERYVAEQTRGEGQLVEAERMWRLALDWYGDRLDPGYTPQVPSRRQELLDAAGLSGPFWALEPAPGEE